MTQKVSPATNVGDMELALRLFGPYFKAPEQLPLSFYYNGRHYAGLPADAGVKRHLVDANIDKTVFTAYLDDTLTVRVECLSYRDFPAVVWTAYFENTGQRNSCILSDVLAIDASFSGNDPMLTHSNGDFYSENGYTVTRLALGDGVIFEQAPTGGRPSDGAVPYQRLMFGKEFGISVSIGWPGQWSCKYKGNGQSVTLSAGQQTVNTYIKPGETLRTPRMTLLAFEGDEIRGVNMWRRYFNAHVTPRSRGNIVEPRLVMCESGGGIEFTLSTEQNQLEAIAYVKEHLPETNLWWIDAGWYPCIGEDGEPNWTLTGDWRPDPARYPNGLGPVGKACREAGMDLLVWMEPERVCKGRGISNEHPEWMLSCEADGYNYLLNLTNPDCFKWLCDTVTKLIKDSGINCYRQDFNFCPLPFWVENSAPDRTGMLENNYVQAYLAYWDFLLADNPGLWIDSCSSGGRRNDLETMRRAVPLHPTDYGYGVHPVNQAFRHVLCEWIPYTRAFTDSWDEDGQYHTEWGYTFRDPFKYDNYKVVNGMGVLSFIANTRVIKEVPEYLPYARKMNNIWGRFAPLMLHGDFYPLTPNHRDPSQWTVFQFDYPEGKEGVIQAMRNIHNNDETLTVYPHGLDDVKKYCFTNDESGDMFSVTGKEAAEQGIMLTQPKRSGAIWFYRAT